MGGSAKAEASEASDGNGPQGAESGSGVTGSSSTSWGGTYGRGTCAGVLVRMLGRLQKGVARGIGFVIGMGRDNGPGDAIVAA